MLKIAFLDRDGVINIDKDYAYKIEDFEFKDGIFEFIDELKKMGYGIIIVTNQSGIGRGYYTLDQFFELDEWMRGELERSGVSVLKTYFCPHRPSDTCNCRKPKPGLIERAKNEFDISLEDSILIGDKISDINAGINGGVGKNILLKGKVGEDYSFEKADFVADNFEQIVEYLKRSTQ